MVPPSVLKKSVARGLKLIILGSSDLGQVHLCRVFWFSMSSLARLI